MIFLRLFYEFFKAGLFAIAVDWPPFPFCPILPIPPAGLPRLISPYGRHL